MEEKLAKNLLSHIKMNRQSLKFGDIKIGKKIFTAIKVIFFKDVDTENLLVSNKISFGEKTYKYFIG